MLWRNGNAGTSRWHRGLVMLVALILLSASLSVLEVGRQLAVPTDAGASTVTTTTSSWSGALSCTGWRSVQVPFGVTSATFKVWGGGGAAGDNYTYFNTASGGNGGRGALVQGTVTGLSAGSFLSAKIGCGGSDGSDSAPGYSSGAGVEQHRWWWRRCIRTVSLRERGVAPRFSPSPLVAVAVVGVRPTLAGQPETGARVVTGTARQVATGTKALRVRVPMGPTEETAATAPWARAGPEAPRISPATR